MINFKLNFALKREIGKDTSRRVMDKMKYHYKEINKRKPKEKGIIGFHRIFWRIGWHQNKCPYYDFFKDEGVVGLTKAYCDLDKRIAELVPNHIELKRQRTLAKGDNCCDFYYYEK